MIRAIGVGRATAMVIGTIIGASIFVQPSVVSASVPSLPGILLVWAAAGALTLIGALITAELSSAYPRSGGVYVFLREAYSPAVGYLWAWAMFWSMHSGIIAAIATVFARYVGHFVPLGDAGMRLTAVASIVALSAVNYAGVRQGSAVQTFFTIVKLAVVVLIVALGATHVAGHGMPQGGHATASLTSGGILAAMVAGLFAYGGWHMVSYAADETQQPARTIPRALVAGTLIVTLAYMAVNASYVAVLPIAEVTSSTRVAADFADVIIGGGGADALSALVIVSTLGAMTGIILAGPRVYMAMAQDGLLFRWAAALHPRYSTPYVAIALQALWSSVLVLTGTYRTLFTRVVYTEWIFFALMAASLFVLRRRPGYAPAYRVPAYALLAGTFVVCSLTIVGYEIVSQPRESAWGLGLVLAGLPVYALWRKRVTASAGPSLDSG